jgi:hypothetical protein
MRKNAYFDNHWGDGWPSPAHVESCLADPKGRQRFFADDHEGGSFVAEGLYGTAGLPRSSGRVDVTLYVIANSKHGLLLDYQKWDGQAQRRVGYVSKGDLNRLQQYVETSQGNLLPIGFFISFESGCNAIKEFITTDGELPSGISWISEDDIPPNTFPGPGGSRPDRA